MIVCIIYMMIGVMIGFLVKHELDIKSKRKRVEKRLQSFASVDTSPHDETLRDIRELNHNLVTFQSKKEAR